jgi:hypothetical protein
VGGKKLIHGELINSKAPWLYFMYQLREAAHEKHKDTDNFCQ